MAEIPWETVTESIGASFDSIRDIYIHSLQAEQSWIRRLGGRSTEGIYSTPFTKYSTIQSIEDYANEVEAETNDYLQRLGNESLQSIVEGLLIALALANLKSLLQVCACQTIFAPCQKYSA